MHQGVYAGSISDMDEKVLKWITGLSFFLTVLVCVCLHYFPDLHMRAALAAENQSREEYGGNGEVIAPAVDAVVEEADGLDAQLKIGLPGGLEDGQLEIENDYLTQTVYIRFAGGVSDYFGEYSIKGSSDHIAALQYYKDNGEGVIMLTLDRVYELEQEYRGDSLYLDFIDPHEIYDKIVVIDAGHGGRAPGAVKQGISEKNIDLAIALELQRLFEKERDIGVYFTRTDDTNPTLEQRVGLANKANADLFISIHNNSSASGNFTRTNGTQVLFSESDESEYSGRRFAQICLENVVESLESRKIGLLHGDDIYIIRNSDAPAALIEVGFMTNYEELDKLKDSGYQKKAAKGIYQAILQAFEEGF